MKRLDYEKIFIKDACPTSIGGQAIMEGVVMQGSERIALAMRLPSGEFYLKTGEKPMPSKLSKVPMVRGSVSFFSSLITGTKTLMDSADILERFAPDEAEEPNKFEKWFERKFGSKALWNMLLVFSVVIALVFSIGIFVILPTIAVNWLKRVTANAIVLNLIEGLLRLTMLILYIAAIRRMPDIKTLFRYHGAEHKTIHCFENNLELTPENARKFYTLHPRCGTSFLMFVFIIALILFSFLGWPNLIVRIASRLLLLPVIAGISYELLKWAGRSDGTVVKILSWPGLMLQKLTTEEPTDEQLEVAIISLKAVLPGNTAELGEGFCDKDGNWLEDFNEEDFLGTSAEKIVEKAENAQAQETAQSSNINAEDITANNNSGSVSFEKVLRWGELQLVRVENGKNEAMMILESLTGVSRAEIITHSKDVIPEDKLVDYIKRIKIRTKGVPLQYILGVQQFMGMNFNVNKYVLIPRPETEVLVSEVVKIMKMKNWKYPQVLDMCTGSGAIGVSVAKLIPDAVVTMTDVSEKAITTADRNAHTNGVNRRCMFMVGDMFKALSKGAGYDVFLCNPPYIETKAIDNLQTEIKDFEPRLALDGGKDGLDFYREIAYYAPKYINRGGIIALETGDGQARAVRKMLDETGAFKSIQIIKDLAGSDRVVIAERI